MNKNKIIEIFNEIKGNKKIAIAILVIFILIAGIVATAVTTINKPAKRKVENVKRSIEDVETPENTGNDSVATPNEKPSRKTFTEKEKNSESKVEKKEYKKSETKSSTSSSSTAARAKTKVWVVDKAAWTEKVTKYRTETQTYTVYRNQNGEEFSTYSAAYNRYANTTDPGTAFGPVNKTRTVTVPYYEYINHPEQGHYEYR